MLGTLIDLAPDNDSHFIKFQSSLIFSYKGQGGNFTNCYKGIIGNYPLIFTEFGVNEDGYFPNGYRLSMTKF